MILEMWKSRHRHGIIVKDKIKIVKHEVKHEAEIDAKINQRSEVQHNSNSIQM